MTNERAIELLRRLQDEQFDGVHGDERREALEMAVRALEPNLGENGSITCMKAEKTHDRTTGDSINRQQAIEAFEPEHHTDWYTPTIIKTLEELPQAQQDKSCKGCHFEKHGSRACDHCSRKYMDRYEVRNVD